MNLEQLKAKITSLQEELKSMKEVETKDFASLEAKVNEIKEAKSNLRILEEAESFNQPVNVAPVVPATNEAKMAQAILEGKSISFELKTTATSSNVPTPKPYMGPMFAHSQLGSSFWDVVRKENAPSNNAQYLVPATFTNNADFAGEGVAPTDSAITYTETFLDARPLINWIPVSETLIDSLQRGQVSQLEEEVMRGWKVKADAEIIKGTAISRSLNSLVGVGATATVTSLGFGGTNLDYRSAIDVCAARIKNTFDTPAVVLCNPLDEAKIKNQKDLNNSFVWTSQSDWGPMYNGMTLVSSGNVTEGTLFVLGQEAARVGIVGGNVNVKMGHNGTDFSAGRQSIRAMATIGLISRPSSIFKLTLI